MAKLKFSSLKSKPSQSKHKWKVLVVDDDESMISITKLVLRSFSYDGRKLQIISASSAEEAREILGIEKDIAVILLDVVMETPDAGLELVKHIREELNNQFVRIVLRTGQPGEAPEHEVIKKYDINDYKLKTELSDIRLGTSLTTALRSYNDLKKLEATYQALANEKERSRMAEYSKQQFLANMSHELRTPLNGILGLTELVEPMVQNEEGKEFIQLINQSGKGLLEVINNTLELSELEQGQIKLASYPIKLKEELQEIMSLMDSQAHWKELETSLTVDDNIPKILRGDGKRLKQILVNQLSNAIRHTETGSIDVHVFIPDEQLPATPLEKHQIAICFSITDTGVGISEEMHEKIFEAFSIGEDCLTKALAGAGLGLAIAGRLIKKMNGKIWVKSKPGEGAQFNFILPFTPLSPQ
ncbi:MAG: ATP-binding protein [Desulfovibrio sp.]